MDVTFEPETILLVDDCDDDVFFFKRALRRAGLHNPVLAVPSIAGAIACLQSQGQPQFPSLCAVVTELIFPGEHGFDLLKWIRAQPQLEGLPLVVLTASIRKKDFELAGEFGATKAFPKTCNPDDLQAAADYLAEVCPQQAPSLDCEPPADVPNPVHRDASELLATLAARLK